MPNKETLESLMRGFRIPGETPAKDLPKELKRLERCQAIDKAVTYASLILISFIASYTNYSDIPMKAYSLYEALSCIPLITSFLRFTKLQRHRQLMIWQQAALRAVESSTNTDDNDLSRNPKLWSLQEKIYQELLPLIKPSSRIVLRLPILSKLQPKEKTAWIAPFACGALSLIPLLIAHQELGIIAPETRLDQKVNQEEPEEQAVFPASLENEPDQTIGQFMKHVLLSQEFVSGLKWAATTLGLDTTNRDLPTTNLTP